MIAGYTIVRKPQFDEIFPGKVLQPINNISYHGMDRFMWYDLEEHFLQTGLSDNLQLTYQDLESSGNDLTFTKLLKSYEVAQRFLTLSNDLATMNEIIAVSSDALVAVKGGISDVTDSIEWLGYDIVLLGGWSLIKHGVFENRQLSLLEAKTLNNFGLFDSLDDISKFLAEYEKLALLDKVEQLLDKKIKLDYVNIGRPRGN